MSAELNIPGDATAAAVRAVRDLDADDEPGAREFAEAAIAAAASLIVAAELERMADTPFEDGPWWALASSLRDRAAELRGEQS